MSDHLSPYLLEKYLDNELYGDDLDHTEVHLKACPECSEELTELRNLKELLNSTDSPAPSQDYFQETAAIINARTIDIDPGKRPRKSSVTDFVRALIAVAASLVLFLSAVYLGSDTQIRQLAEQPAANKLLVITPAFLPATDNTPSQFVTSDRRRELTGMLLLGAPGTLSRFGTLYEFSEYLK